MDDDLRATRVVLDGAPAQVADARAAASAFAVRASSALAHTGAEAVSIDDHAQRLARGSLFLLVFGSRSAIRSSLLERLAP